MKRNQNDQDSVGYSTGQSKQRLYDDINILDPSPDSDVFLLGEEDDDLLDYSLMNSEFDQVYEE
jgi:hypothetical protein